MCKDRDGNKRSNRSSNGIKKDKSKIETKSSEPQNEIRH
jgi:hypothetical protein